MKQHRLFEEPAKENPVCRVLPALERFQGAMLYSAIGDALGWPTEFIQPQKQNKLQFELPIHNFVSWKKTVGGKWWGHEEHIAPGEYSDDTQLTLALARCISNSGEFLPEKFAYVELPLWLDYERGGGKTLKIAAKNLAGKNANWLRNFYRDTGVQYRDAGANGAAMRNLPLALIYCGNETAIIKSSFINSIITHGHPRAILGTIISGLAINYTLLTSKITFEELFQYLHQTTQNIGSIVKQDNYIIQWLQEWDTQKKTEENFSVVFNNTYKEMLTYLKEIPHFLDEPTLAYYEYLGAVNPTTKGSGVVTACAAIYLFLKYADQPEEGLVASANLLGSDTDTIGCLLGALLGAHNGLKNATNTLKSTLQDNKYILELAHKLHMIATHSDIQTDEFPSSQESIQYALKRWKTEFDKMLNGTIAVNSTINHPTLGRGTLLGRTEEPTLRQGYITKLFNVKFDCGQTCTFHARIEQK